MSTFQAEISDKLNMYGLVILDMASVDQGLCKALHGRHCPPLSNDHKVILENIEKGSLEHVCWFLDFA